MKAKIETGFRSISVDLGRPLALSIRMRHGESNPVAWYAEYPLMKTVEMDGFIGSVKRGGSVNTRDITFNPHGNGTHTECIGHLTEEAHEVDAFMREFIFVARVHTVTPRALSVDESEFRKQGDLVIGIDCLKNLELKDDVRALVIRTNPNDETKLNRVYTGSNPPYVDPAAMKWIREQGIEHLLVDLPSVDRESDGGLMKAHREFWYDDDKPRMHATITEMVYVPYSIIDGDYLLNIMISPFGNDAAPSKPVLYPMV